MPNYERSPRDSLTSELIAEVLRPQGRDFAAHSFGEAVTSELSLTALADATLPELANIWPAFTREDYTALTAAVELGRRVEAAKLAAPLLSGQISSTTAAKDFCEQHFSRLAMDSIREEFHTVTLDTKHYVIDTHMISVGTLDCSLVHPREAFRPAIKDAASARIVVHNHPSGNPEPSGEDFNVTDRLKSAGDLLGIELLDHIVVARKGVVSIQESR